MGGGGGGSSYNDLYGEAPHKRGTFFRLSVYRRVGTSQVEVYKRVGNRSFWYLNTERSYKRQGNAPLKHFVGFLCNGGKPV